MTTKLSILLSIVFSMMILLLISSFLLLFSPVSYNQAAYEYRKRSDAAQASIDRQKHEAYERKLEKEREKAMQLHKKSKEDEDADLLDSFFSDVTAAPNNSSRSNSSSSNSNSTSSSSSSHKIHPSWDNSSDLDIKSNNNSNNNNNNNINNNLSSSSSSSDGGDGGAGGIVDDDLLGDFFAEFQPSNKAQEDNDAGGLLGKVNIYIR